MADSATTRARLNAGLRGGLVRGMLCATAATLAYLPIHLAGIAEGFWAAIPAITAIQEDLLGVKTAARDQVVGAAIGGAISLATADILDQPLLAFEVAAILSMTTCFLLGLPGATRVAGITTVILILVPRNGPIVSVTVMRLAAVSWGVIVAVSVVALTRRILPLRTPAH